MDQSWHNKEKLQWHGHKKATQSMWLPSLPFRLKASQPTLPHLLPCPLLPTCAMSLTDSPYLFLYFESGNSKSIQAQGAPFFSSTRACMRDPGPLPHLLWRRLQQSSACMCACIDGSHPFMHHGCQYAAALSLCAPCSLCCSKTQPRSLTLLWS